MKFIVGGATGFIGRALCGVLADQGHEVVGLTRVSRTREGRLRYLTWEPGDTASAATIVAGELPGTSAVVNLAGEPVLSRWGRGVKDRILESRVLSTRALVGALERVPERPRVLVNASAVGFYGARGDDALDESAPQGKDFLAEVCAAWEAEAARAEALGVRVCRLRIGVVLGAGGGALDRMVLPFKLGLGGSLGPGTQWMSWIHLGDLVRLIIWSLETQAAAGPVNAVAPEPVSNAEFSRTLARALGRPCLFWVPSFAVRLAAGEAASVLLSGQRVLPRAALAGGFTFEFPRLTEALSDALSPR
jgi:uncharacterized protein (TIGR01777 family)